MSFSRKESLIHSFRGFVHKSLLLRTSPGGIIHHHFQTVFLSSAESDYYLIDGAVSQTSYQ